MKVLEALEQVKQLKPNAYDDEALLIILNQFEGQVKNELLNLTGDEIVKYDLINDSNTKLFITAPYDCCYPMYISAMIDFNNQEFASYNNQLDMFNSNYSEFKKWYLRENSPLKSLKIHSFD